MRYLILTYYRKANGEIDEVMAVAKNLKNRDHQTANVRDMVEAGGARSIPQQRFTAKELAKQMQKLGLDTEGLINAASRARSVGRPHATRDLADLVEGLDRPAAPQAVGVAPEFKLAGAGA